MDDRIISSNALRNQAKTLLKTQNLNNLDKVELLSYIDNVKKVMRALYS